MYLIHVKIKWRSFSILLQVHIQESMRTYEMVYSTLWYQNNNTLIVYNCNFTNIILRNSTASAVLLQQW